MSDLMLETAKKELIKLKDELKQNSVYQRILAVENLIATYKPSAGYKSEPMTTVIQVVDDSLKGLTKEGKVERLAIECINRNDGYASLAEIHTYLDLHDVQVERPTLSSYLNRFKKTLKSDRKKGWSVIGSRQDA